MPFLPHYRVTLSGNLGTSGEVFSTGFSLGEGSSQSFSSATHTGSGEAGGAVTIDDNQAADISADCAAFWNRPTSHIHPDAVLRTVKIALINADGGTTEEPWGFSHNLPGKGVLTNGRPANQVSVAASLVTQRYGPTGRGRMYLPLPDLACDSAGLYPAVAAGEIAASVRALFEAVNNEPGIDVVNIGVCVASSKGYNTPVTGVRVGRVPDTIRSRRTSLLEQYSAVSALEGNVPDQ